MVTSLEEPFIINLLVNKAFDLANHKPDKCIIFQREKDKAELNLSIDITWEEAIKNAKAC